jgi:polysaccharide export outer membrane protein
MTRRGVIALLLALLSWTAPAAWSGDAAGYVVGPSDVLRVQVWKQPELSGTYTVSSDGAITLPLIGRVDVRGLTTSRVEDVLTRRLAEGYLREPQVVVSIEQHRSQRIFISGAVHRPGAMLLDGPLTLLEALARAGTLTERAGRTAMIARPRTSGDGPAPFTGASEIVRVDLAALERGDLDSNLALRDGDTIVIPVAATVHVMGEVARPGEYPIFETTRVAEVISRAGGITERGSSKRIRVVRMEGGHKVESKLALEDTLQPGDIVIVLERLF